jgi:transposase
MLIFTKSLRVCLAAQPIDFRGGFDRLSALVDHELGQSTLSSQVFVFTNKRRNLIRLLYWDGTGLWLMTKRLEKGTFAWPLMSLEAQTLGIKPEALEMLLSGIDLKGSTMRPWYLAPEAEAKAG